METLKYTSIAELVNTATERGEAISQIVLRDQAEQMDTEPKVLFNKMRDNYHVMQESIQKGTDPNIRSTSGLTGGDAYKLYSVHKQGKSLTGSFISGAIWRALAVSELNAAMVELAGGTPAMSGEAVAIAIKNILGLVCDPVAGLVEIPCIKRNAGGVTTAFMAAEVALAGIASHIPADETILAMKRIGDTLPATLRETAEGGLAMTPTGQKLNTLVFGENADTAACSSCRACR